MDIPDLPEHIQKEVEPAIKRKAEKKEAMRKEHNEWRRIDRERKREEPSRLANQ